MAPEPYASASKSESESPDTAAAIAQLKSKIRKFPDFPSKGILFEDILPIFADAEAFKTLIATLARHITSTHGTGGVDVIVGLDARGFLFGPSLALALGAGFVPVRKAGKVPGQVHSATYEKEYGSDAFEMQVDAILPHARVVVVDDIIATGGSARAAGELVGKCGAQTLEYVFMLELDFLHGRDKLDAPVFTLLSSQ